MELRRYLQFLKTKTGGLTISAVGLVVVSAVFFWKLASDRQLEKIAPVEPPLAVSKAPAKVEFNQHIRPILSDNCFQCHGPDEEAREAELRLDTPEGIVADLGGYRAVSPGDLAGSELYKRITHEDPDERMPPEESHKTLTEKQIQWLAQWIREGAEWQQLWSFEPLLRPTLPGVTDADWVGNPIDAFVLARMAEEGLSPSAQANQHVLSRRLSLDLTGLPPTPEAIESFVADESEDAYERLVDRLLASTSYGEHRAHYWLDAARYSDTHGLGWDNYRSIWPYRDWVVDAFNANMPFDQFTIEQLAGDLLPDATTSQLVATGFNRSNPTTSEGGSIDEEYLAIYASDRVETTATVWMGLTIGCARCHDHKFDPLTIQDHYRFAAFFRNTTQAAMDKNIANTPPYLIVSSPDVDQRRENIRAEMDKTHALIEKHKQQSGESYSAWLAGGGEIDTSIPVAADSLEFQAMLDEGSGRRISGANSLGSWTGQVNGNFQWIAGPYGKALAITNHTLATLGSAADFRLNDSFSVSLWVRRPKEETGVHALIGKFDLEARTVRRRPTAVFDRGWFVAMKKDGEISLELYADEAVYAHARTKNGLDKEAWHHVVLTYNGSGSPGGFGAFVDGEPVETTAGTKVFDVSEHAATPPVGRELVIGGLDTARILDPALTPPKEPAGYVGLQDVRVFDEVMGNEEIRQLYRAPYLRRGGSQAVADGERDIRQNYHASQLSPTGLALARELRGLRAELAAVDRRSAVTLIMEEKTGSIPEANVLIRGQYDNPGQKVTAGVPEVLPQLPDEQLVNRLSLANWLVDPAHPLTARVAVNRMWQELFGTGLVATSEDFGSQGEPPGHPKLLDWLAVEFMDSGWDVKHLYKLLVMSSTYRQDSSVNQERLARDPDNRLLSRGPRFRLDAEVIRDQALQLSGLLVDRLGGPPVRPYQPDGVWKAVSLIESNTEIFQQDHGEKLYRKSLYTFQKRSAAPPSMTIFDAVSRQSCAMRREITNTPLQALVLLNDPQFVEAARNLGQRVLLSDAVNKFKYLLEYALGRDPDQEMVDILRSTYDEVFTTYRDEPASATALLNVGESEWRSDLDSAELASWTIVASQVLNLDELITKP